MHGTSDRRRASWWSLCLVVLVYLLSAWVAAPVVKARGTVTRLGHDSWVGALAFSPGGGTLATGCGDGTVKVWDTTTWKELYSLQSHKDAVSAIAFSEDGSWKATGSL